MKISEILESSFSNNYLEISTILKNMERGIIDSIDRVHNLDSDTHIDVVKSIVVDIDDVINDINTLMTQLRIPLDNKNPNDNQLISLMTKIRNNITSNREKLRDIGLNEAEIPPQGSTFSPLTKTAREQPRVDPAIAAGKRKAERRMRQFMGHRD